MKDVLLLNQDGNPLTLWPLSTITWQQAIKALYLDKVTVLRSYDDWICHSQHLALPVPSVVMMAQYHYQKGTVILPAVTFSCATVFTVNIVNVIFPLITLL